MQLKSDTIHYIEDINRINKQQDFRLNNIDYPIVDRVVLGSDGKVIAYGIVKKMAEAIILLDLERPNYEKAKALKLLMPIAEEGARIANCEQLHFFLSNPILSFSLQNHYGFKQSHDIVLVKDLR